MLGHNISLRNIYSLIVSELLDTMYQNFENYRPCTSSS